MYDTKYITKSTLIQENSLTRKTNKRDPPFLCLVKISGFVFCYVLLYDSWMYEFVFDKSPKGTSVCANNVALNLLPCKLLLRWGPQPRSAVRG